MSKLILDEAMRLNIIINGNEAQKELLDLESANRKLVASNKDLNAERTKLIAQGKKNTDEYKNLTAQIKLNNAELTKNKSRMDELQKEIGITGLSLNQLKKRATELRLSLNNMIPGSAEHKRYQAELQNINTRIAELSGKSKQAESSVSKLANGFNKYAVLGASVVATLTGVVLSIQKIIDYNGKLSDSQADVMKTTGMTKKEVDELTKSFGLLKTRTQRIDLLKIAEEGGRIGIVKEEIGQFVEVMNKANVALGDSFTGGVEEVASKLGKLKFLFSETKDLGVDQAYNSIGSAINDLGASGNATERNIAEFTTRIGSLPDALKPGIADALALGAAFEESGIEAEISARAYNIFLKQAATETKKFATVMGVSQKEVEKMINDDPLEFFLTFAERLRGLDMEGVQMAQTLEFLGVNADGANKILGAAANNTDRFRQLMDLSNNSMINGTSLINEYNIKNNILAATLEKIKKTVTGWFSSDTFVKWLGTAVTWISEFIGASDDANTSASKWRTGLAFLAKVIGVITAAIITNVTWQKLVYLWSIRNSEATKLNIFWTKAKAVAEKAGIVITQAFAAVQMLLTGNVKGATQALRVMTATMKTTPWGLVLSLVAAAVTAYQLFKKEVDESAKKQKIFSDLQKDVAENTAKEVSELQRLVLIARDDRTTKEDKLAAIKKINEISPEYLGNITLETINTLEAKNAIDAYIKSLKQKAMEEALNSKREELYKKQTNLQIDYNKTHQKSNTISETIGNVWDELWGDTDNFEEYLKKQKDISDELKYIDDLTLKNQNENSKNSQSIRENELRQLDLWYSQKIIKANGNKKEMDKINAEFEKKKNEINNHQPTQKNDVPDDTKIKATSTSSGKTPAEIEAEKNAKILELKRQHQDNVLALMTDGFAKEIALENQNYERKIQDLEARKTKEPYLAKEIDALIEDEKRMHETRIAIIRTNAETKKEKQIQQSFERESQQRETNFYNELSQMDLTEEERKKKIEEFQQQELDIKIKYLETNLSKLKELVSVSNSDESDIILTDEQTQELLDKIATLENALAKLNDEKSQLKGESTEPKKGKIKDTKAGDIDVLGFKAEQWEETFSNLDTTARKLEAVMMGIQALANAYALYDQYRTASENRLLANYTATNNKQKEILKKRLDSGKISQEEYNKRVEKLDNDLEEKKYKIELAQAKRQKAMALAQIAINTAQAIISIWAQVPKFDFGISAGILTGVVAALAAVQAAVVLKQPLPVRGAEDGFYPVQREQDGKMFRARYGGSISSGLVTKPTYFLTGENNRPEMILDNKVYSRMNPSIRKAMHSEVARIKGFEDGYYPKENQSTSAQNEMLYTAILINLQKNNELLKELANSGIIAHVSNKDLKSMKNLKEGINNYDALINRTKI